MCGITDGVRTYVANYRAGTPQTNKSKQECIKSMVAMIALAALAFYVTYYIFFQPPSVNQANDSGFTVAFLSLLCGGRIR